MSKVLAVGLFAFIGWIIFLADTGSPSVFFELVKSVPHGDKIGHFGLFGLLTFLVNWALDFRHARATTEFAQIGSILVFVFASLEELSQYFFPNRTLDAMDFLSDIAAISAFTLASVVVSRKNHRKSVVRSG